MSREAKEPKEVKKTIEITYVIAAVWVRMNYQYKRMVLNPGCH